MVQLVQDDTIQTQNGLDCMYVCIWSLQNSDDTLRVLYGMIQYRTMHISFLILIKHIILILGKRGLTCR